MGKKSRRIRTNSDNKPVKELKTTDERKQLVETGKIKLASFGLGEGIPGIVKFNEICDEYIQSGENQMGIIPLDGFKRVLKYILPIKKQTDISIILQYNKNV